MADNAVEGRKVAGRYDLLTVRGRGGMGVVWEAEDALLGRRVAVKEIDLRTGDKGVRERALREARAAARVSHPNLVTVYDAVEEDGRLFLIQELIDAPTLKEHVRREGPIPPDRCTDVALQLARALEVVHAAGVVHRDVKPSNVMLLEDGGVKLGDFGVARIAGDPDLTATGVVIGSPAYLAPEQARGDAVTAAVDWWSLGATLFFAAEGRAPFEGTTMAVLSRLAEGETPAPSATAGVLGPVLVELFRPDPAERAGAERVRTLLSEALNSGEETRPGLDPDAAVTAELPQTAPPTGGAPATVATPVTAAAPEAAAAPARAAEPAAAPMPRGLVAAVGAVVVLFLVVAAFALATDGADPAHVAENGSSAAEAEAVSRQFDNWTEYRDQTTGYVVRYPESWSVRQRDTRTDFVDPETGAYLRVDWTDEPGPSPEGAWEELSRRFADRYETYEEIAIEPTEFKGLDAALWEYRYEADGALLHAYNLGMVNEDYGFALNFQAPEEEWASYQEAWELLKQGFQPALADDDNDDGDDEKDSDDEKDGEEREGNEGNGKGKGKD